MKSITARGFWINGLVTLPMTVNLLASMRSSQSVAGIRTGGRLAGSSGGACHFPFSERLYRLSILVEKGSFSFYGETEEYFSTVNINFNFGALAYFLRTH